MLTKIVALTVCVKNAAFKLKIKGASGKNSTVEQRPYFVCNNFVIFHVSAMGLGTSNWEAVVPCF